MILRFIVVSCDRCCEESTPYSTVAQTRRIAKASGWQLGRKPAADLCPRCKASPSDRPASPLEGQQT